MNGPRLREPASRVLISHATASSTSFGAAETTGSRSGCRRFSSLQVLPTCPRVGGPRQPSVLVRWQCCGPVAGAVSARCRFFFSRRLWGSSAPPWLTPFSQPSLVFQLAAIGLLAALPIFWSLASSRLTGKAAGAAIAHGQLRWSRWRICRALCHGMAARCYTSLLGRAVGHRRRYGAGRMPCLWRIRKTALFRDTSS